MKKGNVLVDLLGRRLRVESFQFANTPEYSGVLCLEHSVTKDRISGERIILSRDKEDNWIGITFNIAMGLYVKYKLTYLGYDESQDMRYSWKYGRNTKAPKREQRNAKRDPGLCKISGK